MELISVGDIISNFEASIQNFIQNVVKNVRYETSRKLREQNSLNLIYCRMRLEHLGPYGRMMTLYYFTSGQGGCATMITDKKEYRKMLDPIIDMRCVSTKYGDSLLATIEDPENVDKQYHIIYLNGIIPTFSHRSRKKCITRESYYSWILQTILSNLIKYFMYYQIVFIVCVCVSHYLLLKKPLAKIT